MKITFLFFSKTEILLHSSYKQINPHSFQRCPDRKNFERSKSDFKNKMFFSLLVVSYKGERKGERGVPRFKIWRHIYFFQILKDKVFLIPLGVLIETVGVAFVIYPLIFSLLFDLPISPFRWINDIDYIVYIL